MPELPEVETVVRSLRPHVVGRALAHVGRVRGPTLAEGSMPLSAAAGMLVRAVRRRGKLILMDLAAPGTGEGTLVLAVHLRMTGALMAIDGLYADREALASLATPYTRFILGLSDGAGAGFPCCCALRFDDVRTFGRALLTDMQGLERWPFWRGLGPEPLEVGSAEFAARLRGRRAVKAALLDQTVIAGLGNIYADEALFMARINPRRPASALAPDEADRLLEAIRAVLTLSIRQCGSSIRDYRDADGNAGAFQNSFSVYGRSGLPCPRCGTALVRDRVAGRGTVFCPRCQPAGGGSR